MLLSSDVSCHSLRPVFSRPRGRVLQGRLRRSYITQSSMTRYTDTIDNDNQSKFYTIWSRGRVLQGRPRGVAAPRGVPRRRLAGRGGVVCVCIYMIVLSIYLYIIMHSTSVVFVCIYTRSVNTPCKLCIRYSTLFRVYMQCARMSYSCKCVYVYLCVYACNIFIVITCLYIFITCISIFSSN